MTKCLSTHVLLTFLLITICWGSVAKSCPTFCNLIDCSKPGFAVLHYLPELAQSHVCWVDDGIQAFHLFPSLLFLPSVLSILRVFSNESDLHIRWSEYWNYNFNISSCNEYSGLISFWIDWFDLLAIQRNLKSLLWHHNSKI